MFIVLFYLAIICTKIHTIVYVSMLRNESVIICTGFILCYLAIICTQIHEHWANYEHLVAGPIYIIDFQLLFNCRKSGIFSCICRLQHAKILFKGCTSYK